MNKSIVFAVINFFLIQFGVVLGQCPVSSFTINSQPSPESCSDQVFTIQNLSTDAIAYEWDFCASDLQSVPTGALSATLTTIGSYDAIKIVKDGGLFYGFVAKLASGGLYRLEFGTDLNNSPTVVSLGTAGLSGSSAITLVKDAGTWYALVATGNNLFRLTFTAGLSGNSASITSTNLGNFGGTLTSPRGLDVVKEEGNYYAFLTNSAGAFANSITVIRFSGSLTGATSSANIAVPGSSSLLAISLIKECDSWYGLMTSTGNSKLIKAKFGTDLTNTSNFQFVTQTGVSIQSFGLDIVRENASISAFLITLSGSSVLYQLNFGSSVWANNPTVISRGSLSGLSNSIAMDFITDQSNVVGFIGNRTNFELHKVRYPNNCAASTAYSTDFEPANVMYNGVGTYSIELKSTDSNGNENRVVKMITVLPKPTVDFSSDKNCNSQVTVFDDQSGSSNGSISTWLWDFAGQGTSGVENPTYTFPLSGDYNISLAVQDSKGCGASITKSVKIYPVNDITPDFTFGSKICTYGDSQFTDLSSYGQDVVSSWSWDFGVGGQSDDISMLQNPTYAFQSAGTYNVSLIATGISGCSYQVIKPVTVEQGPDVDFGIQYQCFGDQTQFSNLTTGAVVSYSWDLGEGLPLTEESPVHTYTSTGNYSVSLTTTGIEGCVTTKTKVIKIYTKPLPDFSLSLPPFSCNGSPSIFNDATPNPDDSNLTSWEWDFGDAGSTSSNQNPQHTYQDAGSYNVSLTVGTNFGCENSIQKSVTIEQTPDIEILNTPSCKDQAVEFSVNSNTPIQNWNWQIGNTFYYTSNPTYVFTSPGGYTIYLDAIGSNGCVASTSKAVTVHETLVPAFTVQKNCVNQQTEFADATIVMDDPVVSYDWDANDLSMGTDPSVIHTFQNTGTYAIQLNITTEEGCVYSTTQNIDVISSPQADFIANPDVGVPPFTVQFVNTSTDALSYLWNFNDPDNTTSTQVSPQFDITDFGNHVIDLTAFNALNCSSTVSKIVKGALPVIDVALDDFSVSENQDGFLTAVVTVHNKGNTVIKDLNLLINLAGIMVQETLPEEIPPSSSIDHLVNFNIFPGNTLGYICVTADLDQDADPSDNQLCIAADGGSFVFTPYPNPSNGIVNMEWITQESEPVSIQAYDYLGKRYQDASVISSAGLNRFTLDLSNAKDGLYLVVFNSGQIHRTFRILMVR